MNVELVMETAQTWRVHSDSLADVEYTVWRLRGRWGCNCPATVESSVGKCCRHIKRVAAQQLQEMLNGYSKLNDGGKTDGEISSNHEPGNDVSVAR